uniref:Uncharacterized protein n=1 Tax=Trichogramma kaykai TaxID=54128 RepID=A0ABD2XNM9_9HYME
MYEGVGHIIRSARERERGSKRKTARARNNARKILRVRRAARLHIYYNRVLIIDGLNFLILSGSLRTCS